MAGLAIVALLLLSGCHSHARTEASADDDASAPIVQVELKPVVRTSLDETIEVLGVTQPLRNRTARLTTSVEGRVAAILPAATAKDLPWHDSPGQYPPANDASGNDASGKGPPRPAVEGGWVTEQQVIVRLDDSLAPRGRRQGRGCFG